MKLKVNDPVQITVGKDAGQKSKITKVFGKTNKIIVEGYNKYQRHMKKRSDKEPGGVIAIERAMNASKVALICKHCKKITRIGYQTLKTGEKIRICKKCQGQLDSKKA